jgi:hypothetical protein
MDDTSNEADEKDGSFGLLIVIIILILTSIVLFGTLLYFKQRFVVCSLNPLMFCPNLVCDDNSNPISQQT